MWLQIKASRLLSLNACILHMPYTLGLINRGQSETENLLVGLVAILFILLSLCLS